MTKGEEVCGLVRNDEGGGRLRTEKALTKCAQRLALPTGRVACAKRMTGESLRAAGILQPRLNGIPCQRPVEGD